MIGDPNTDNPQSPLTHALHFVARTLNIPSSQYSIANPRPPTTKQHERYTRAATVCPCPVLKVSTPGYPHMCEYCDLLRHVLTKSPTNDYPVCASPHPNEESPNTCADCVIIALIHQNTFATRCTDMQRNMEPTWHSQLHPSLNSPQPGNSASPSQDHGTFPVSVHVPTPTSTTSAVRPVITLVLPPHTHVEVQTVLTVNPSSPICTRIHIAHPVLPLTLKNLHSLHNHRTLTIPTIFHHLRISATSPLIPYPARSIALCHD